eukprot:10422235-Ditylum_brightwellii.AAC.2
MHDPPPEQTENDDDDSTCVPNKEGSEKDDDSIPSIKSLNDVAIYHNTDDFEPPGNATDTIDTTTTIIAAEENNPEEERSASDTMTAGVYAPSEDTDEDDSFTA